MHDRDQRFYTKLFIIFFALAFIIRMIFEFVGVKFEIPYVDPFLKALWKLLGSALKAFSKKIGGWGEA